jgi:hypothetical protein
MRFSKGIIDAPKLEELKVIIGWDEISEKVIKE